MPTVEEVTLETRDQAYESLKDSLKDRPDLLADLKPESMAVEKAVRALPHTESVEFEDRDAAYERLREQCRGKGDLATQLDRQMTLASLRLQMPLDPRGKGASELLTFDGVDVVRLVPVARL